MVHWPCTIDRYVPWVMASLSSSEQFSNKDVGVSISLPTVRKSKIKVISFHRHPDLFIKWLGNNKFIISDGMRQQTKQGHSSNQRHFLPVGWRGPSGGQTWRHDVTARGRGRTGRGPAVHAYCYWCFATGAGSASWLQRHPFSRHTG